VNLEALNKPDWRYALGGRNWASFEIHLEATLVQSLRPYLSECADALGGCDRATLDQYLEAVDGWPTGS
jgi:hypothetical protein